jgi:hypothetical protein
MPKRFRWFFAGFFLVSAFLITNCKDDENNLGLNIQPPNDKLNIVSTDTTAVIAYSQLVDSIKTDETSLSLLGSMSDPVFGSSTAGFCTQLRLGQTAYSFGSSPLPDSLVLTLKYNGFYGDSSADMTVKVYELDEQILFDSSYYSNHSVAFKETLLARKTFIPDFADSVLIDTVRYAPHLRINLTSITQNLAVKLLEAPSDSMASNTSFLNYFYGLYVTAEPVGSGGSIIYFDLMSSVSGMTLYYHNATDDSLKFTYTINSNCARFGKFTHDYSLASPAFRAQVLDKDTTFGKSICYLQSLAGVKTFIRFPNIKNFYTDHKIAVNEARFFMSGLELNPFVGAASTLVMVKKDSTGGYNLLKDQLNGSDYFGGTYDKNSRGYWFRITESIQDLMRSTMDSTFRDYGFELYVSGGSVNAQRVVLNGTSPLNPELLAKRMKLVITYTKLN